MKTLPLSQAKARLSRLVKSVHATDEEVVITKNGKPAAVLVSPDEFDAWRETAKIRSNPGFVAEIKGGLKALKRKDAKIYDLDELFGN